MRRFLVLLAVGGWVLWLGWPHVAEAEGVMLPGLVAGVGLGVVVFLVLTAAAGGVGRLLNQTRLEDAVLSVDAPGDVAPSQLDWPEALSQAGMQINKWLAAEQQRVSGESRRFVWEERLRSTGIVAEAE